MIKSQSLSARKILRDNLEYLLVDSIYNSQTGVSVKVSGKVLDRIMGAIDTIGRNKTLREKELLKLEKLERENWKLKSELEHFHFLREKGCIVPYQSDLSQVTASYTKGDLHPKP